MRLLLALYMTPRGAMCHRDMEDCVDKLWELSDMQVRRIGNRCMPIVLTDLKDQVGLRPHSGGHLRPSWAIDRALQGVVGQHGSG